MSRAMSRVVLAAAVVCMTAVGSFAQQATSTETKSFEVLAVDGNQLVVILPEGTRELTVPEDFRFTVNGQSLSVRQLTVGMRGTATITTRTTTTPVTVTQVKNGTVVQASGANIIVRTETGVQSFTQGDIDKRGVKIMREGKPARISDFRSGDRLSATIITSGPPTVMTEREVQATLAAAPAPAPAAAPRPAPAPVGVTAGNNAAPPALAPTPPAAPRTLPKTASSWPLVGILSVLSLAVGSFLTTRRRLAR